MLIAILKPAETPAVGVSIVIVSVPALVVIVVPPVPAKFKVAAVLSATILDCPLTATVPNTLLADVGDTSCQADPL